MSNNNESMTGGLPEKLIVGKMTKIFTTYYGTLRFITGLKEARQWNLYSAS